MMTIDCSLWTTCISWAETISSSGTIVTFTIAGGIVGIFTTGRIIFTTCLWLFTIACECHLVWCLFSAWLTWYCLIFIKFLVWAFISPYFFKLIDLAFMIIFSWSCLRITFCQFTAIASRIAFNFRV